MEKAASAWGVVLIVAGVLVVLWQAVSYRPWPLGVLLGLVLAFFGALLLEREEE